MRRAQQRRPHRLGERPGRVGDDPEGTARQARPPDVGPHDRDGRAGESKAQLGDPRRVPFDRDHSRPRLDEGGRQRAGSGAEIDDQVTVADARPGHDVAGGRGIKPVPAPPLRRRRRE
jgi:hypothetical protein